MTSNILDQIQSYFTLNRTSQTRKHNHKHHHKHKKHHKKTDEQLKKEQTRKKWMFRRRAAI